MTLLRKFELAGGVTTGVLGFVAPFYRHGADTFELFWLWPGLLLEALVLFIVPGLLVAIGSYVHSVGLKTWGFVMLSVCGMFLTVMSLIYFFGGAIFYLFGLGGVDSSFAVIDGNNNSDLIVSWVETSTRQLESP